VVHNGIIENYHSLKTVLMQEGHVFCSQTDTEVISHLIEKFYDGNLISAVSRALRCLEGTYGLAVMHSNSDEIVVARRGSPMIIGIGKNEMLAASDASALLPYTKHVVYLEDGQLAVLSPESWCLTNFDGSEVAPEVVEITWEAEQIEKGNYAHFMLKEIMEQSLSVANTLRGRVGEKIKLSLSIVPAALRRIILVACGTSWHSALLGEQLIERIAGIPAEVDYASEFRYRKPLLEKTDLVIVISQSGETADTLAALRESKAQGAQTLGIINVVGSTISREAGQGIFVHAGPEIGVASTKAFSCQVTALVLFALYCRQEKGLVIESNLIAGLHLLPEKINEVFACAKQVEDIALSFTKAQSILFLARGLQFPVALEGALKMKEVSYIHAEGYPAGEMKHGPIALVDPDCPVVFIAMQGPLLEKVINNIEEICARKGRITVITDCHDIRFQSLATNIIQVPAVCEELSPLMSVIPLQLLAYHVARLRGIDVDRPRNLAKSVTVE